MAKREDRGGEAFFGDKSCRPPDPPAGQIQKVLARYGIREEAVVDTVVCLMAHKGLFSAAKPEPGMTARQIRRAARASASAGERRSIEALMFQTVRGDVVTPIGPHRGRRPEPEVAYTMQLLDRFLEQERRMHRWRRHRCIAELLSAAEGVGRSCSVTEASVRKRLDRANRATPLSAHAYAIERWRCNYLSWEHEVSGYVPAPAAVGTTAGTTTVDPVGNTWTWDGNRWVLTKPKVPPPAFPVLTGEASLFLLLHAHAHACLHRWRYRKLARSEEAADEFVAAVLLAKELEEEILPTGREGAVWWVQDDDTRRAWRAHARCALSPERAQLVLRLMGEEAFLARWRKILTPQRLESVWKRFEPELRGEPRRPAVRSQGPNRRPRA